jgi:hypothetical protein
MVDLAKWGREASEREIQNIASRGLHLSCEEIRDILTHMGHSMSMRKLHRKIAIMRVVLDMQEGEKISSYNMLERATGYIRNCSSITVDMVGAIMRIVDKWGFVTTMKKQYNSREQPMNVYVRTSRV